MTDVIQHELNHARQSMCKCHSKWSGYNNILSFYTNKDLSFNIESTAEAKVLIDNYFNENKTIIKHTYEQEINYEILLLLQVMLDEKKDINGYYDAILDNNLQNYWKYFNLNTTKEYENFYKILYSINTLDNRTSLSNLINEEIMLDDSKSKIELVGYSYLVEIFKNSIIDLIKENEINEYDIDYSLLIYLLIKSYIVDSTKTGKLEFNINHGNCQVIYDNNFINKILLIEDEFINYISTKYNKSTTEIEEKLYSDELLNKLKEFIEYSQNNQETNNEIMFNDLLQKYPIMKYIVWIDKTSYNHIECFNEFVEDNKQLKKKN